MKQTQLITLNKRGIANDYQKSEENYKPSNKRIPEKGKRRLNG
jgi:hypothetical protein